MGMGFPFVEVGTRAPLTIRRTTRRKSTGVFATNRSWVRRTAEMPTALADIIESHASHKEAGGQDMTDSWRLAAIAALLALANGLIAKPAHAADSDGAAVIVD